MRTLALLLLVSAVVFAQATGDKDCLVDGSVVNSVSGAPILRAHVSVAGANGTVFADSDSAGRWKAEHIACGRVAIIASRVGFLRGQKNTVSAANQTLVANAPLHGVRLELTPQAVLAGRVLDDQGDPILGAQVSLMTSHVINGLRGIQASTSTTTNDLGEYRFSGLPAGKYVLCVNAGGGLIVSNGARPYGEKCYPGPMDAGPAIAMDVAAGFEGRIDFALSPVATLRVTGVVSGQPNPVGTTVNLIPRTQIARMSMGLSGNVNADGTFLIPNVPPGSYTASAISGRLKARAPVDVGNSDTDGLQLHLEPGVTVTGKIVSATERKPGRQAFFLTLRNSDPNIGGSQLPSWDDSMTSFTVPDVIAGRYRVEISPPAPFYVRSVTMGGRDVAGSEFTIAPGAGNIEIVLSDDGGVVEGDVSTNDAPAAAWIFLQKDGAPSRNARADAGGHFSIDTVAPGEYKIYAWDDNTTVEYANPDWMERNGKGVAVTVEPGKHAQVKLTRQTAPTE